MKALAARTRDVDDALRICRDFYPDEAVSPRALGVLQVLFG
jgi:hypothetical protein